jgi:hypothetical protein
LVSASSARQWSLTAMPLCTWLTDTTGCSLSSAICLRVPRTLLRRPAEPWSVDEIAARDGRAAVEMSAPLGLAVAHRILEVSPSHGRRRVLRRASDRPACGGTVSVHNVTPAREILVSEVRVSCGRTPRGSLVLRLYGPDGSRTVMRRQMTADRAGRLIAEPVLRAGVGGGRMFVADPGQIEIVEPAGGRRVIRRPSSEVFAGAEINDRGDLLFHTAGGGRFATSLIRRGQAEPVELVEAPLDRAASVRLCGDLIVRHARRGNGEAELSVAGVKDTTRYRRLRAWPARLGDADLVCDGRRAVLIRQRGTNGPSSAEVVLLPRSTMRPRARTGFGYPRGRATSPLSHRGRSNGAVKRCRAVAMDEHEAAAPAITSPLHWSATRSSALGRRPRSQVQGRPATIRRSGARSGGRSGEARGL